MRNAKRIDCHQNLKKTLNPCHLLGLSLFESALIGRGSGHNSNRCQQRFPLRICFIAVFKQIMQTLTIKSMFFHQLFNLILFDLSILVSVDQSECFLNSETFMAEQHWFERLNMSWLLQNRFQKPQKHQVFDASFLFLLSTLLLL